jgi:hypothetical protein
MADVCVPSFSGTAFLRKRDHSKNRDWLNNYLSRWIEDTLGDEAKSPTPLLHMAAPPRKKCGSHVQKRLYTALAACKTNVGGLLRGFLKLRRLRRVHDAHLF